MSLTKAASSWFRRSRSTSHVGRAVPRPLAAAPSARSEMLEARTLLTVNPVMVYAFDEGGGSVVTDVSTDGDAPNNGHLVNEGGYEPSFSSDRPSPAGGSFMRFDFNGRIELDQLLSPVLGGSSTLSYYIRTDAYGQSFPGSSPGITGVDLSNQNNNVFWGNIDYAGRIKVQVEDQPGLAAGASTPFRINDFQWHHVTHTRDGGTGALRTYVDGRLVGEGLEEAGVKDTPFGALGAIALVDPGIGLFGYTPFTGDLDQVEIFDRVVGPREIAERYSDVTAPLSAPTNLVASGDAVGGVRLSFDEVSSALGYTVSRATSPAGPFEEIGTLAAKDPVAGTPETKIFVDSGLEAGRQYYYRVSAFNGGGESPAASADAAAGDSGTGVKAYFYESEY